MSFIARSVGRRNGERKIFFNVDSEMKQGRTDSEVTLFETAKFLCQTIVLLARKKLARMKKFMYTPMSTQSPGMNADYVQSEDRQYHIPNYQQMHNPGNPYSINQHNPCIQSHYNQPMQQDPAAFGHNQQQVHQNFCPPYNPQIPSSCVTISPNPPLNPCLCVPPPMGPSSQPQMVPCGNFLPQNIIEQVRSCIGNTAPIFIIPNAQTPIPQAPQIHQPQNMGFSPPQGPIPNPVFTPQCYTFPFPFPVYDPFGNLSQIDRNNINNNNNNNICTCCRSKTSGSNNLSENDQMHRCTPGNDDTLCTKSNCPSSINLQALASQFLSLQGVIPCAATRLILRKIPGSNLTSSIEETMERAQKSIGNLRKEQLIVEARNAQQLNGLINLHMVASPPQNILPILTMLQLKVNSLKALVESLINKSITECQSTEIEGNVNLEPVIMTLKSDAELRELLGSLRQRECEERVNVSYSPYHSQRVVAESRLANFQNKIGQVEAEMERRRASAMPWAFTNAGGNWQQCSQGRVFDSPSPFTVQIRNPRRLNLKPDVGSPKTTYDEPERRNSASAEVVAVNKLQENICKECKGGCEDQKICCSEDQELNQKKVDLEEKKKLKIHIGETGNLSVKKQSLEELKEGKFIQLSPDVVLVINKDQEIKKEPNKEKRKKIVKDETRQSKSKESISTASSCDSWTSISSKSENDDDERRGRKKEEKSRKKRNSKNFKK